MPGKSINSKAQTNWRYGVHRALTNDRGLFKTVFKSYKPRQTKAPALKVKRNVFNLTCVQLLQKFGVSTDGVYPKLDRVWTWSAFGGQYDTEFDQRCMFFWEEEIEGELTAFFTLSESGYDETLKQLKIEAKSAKSMRTVKKLFEALAKIMYWHVALVVDRADVGQRWNSYTRKAVQVLKAHAKKKVGVEETQAA